MRNRKGKTLKNDSNASVAVGDCHGGRGSKNKSKKGVLLEEAGNREEQIREGKEQVKNTEIGEERDWEWENDLDSLEESFCSKRRATTRVTTHARKKKE